MNTFDKLNLLADLRAQTDIIKIHFDDLRAEILTPEIKAALAEIDAEYQTAIEALNTGIATLETEIKAEVIQGGATVKGAHLQAVYNKGRVSWDTKALDGYAAGHPEIMPFRKVGEPSVSIR